MTALPGYEAALEAATAGITPLPVESVELARAAGRVLRNDVRADRDLPPFNRAQMDGYALRAAELGRQDSWPVAATVPAGAPADMNVPPGSCVAIATGAPLPSDVDTVIQHELSDRADPVKFTIDSIEPGHAVHPRGADATTGDVLIRTGTMLHSHHLGVAASVGASTLEVTRRPRAVVLCSGDEIVSVGEPVETHQIRNSNGPMVCELIERMGAESLGHRHVVDDKQQTIDIVGEAIADADIVITIGGISAGDRDYFPAAFARHNMVSRVVGAAIQPGKPVRVGHVPRGTSRDCAMIVGLPGNPVSVLACACLFAWPIIRAMLGVTAGQPWRDVELAESVKPNARRQAFRPAILDGAGRATVPRWAGSGDLCHTSPTHGLVELPVQTEEVEAGAVVRFLPWP